MTNARVHDKGRPARERAEVVTRGPAGSTYRVQLHAGFTFRQAEAIVPYLARLGIAAVYLSPFLRARPGSVHGYDICDHTEFNPEIGTRDDYESLSHTIGRYGMLQLLDTVPNHMAAHPDENPWWRDVLENGQSSIYSHFFDIDWVPRKSALTGKLLLPVLGDPFGVCLERGDLKVEWRPGEFVVRYADMTFPVDPATWSLMFPAPPADLQQDPLDEKPSVREFISLITGSSRLPDRTRTEAEGRIERRRESAVLKERLARLSEEDPSVLEQIAIAISAINGTPNHPRSYDALQGLLDAQPYRLAYWKTAFHEINYRRFFDVNGLAALRVEDPQVFRSTHRLLFDLISKTPSIGLRIDHIDGLYNPRDYLDALQREYRALTPSAEGASEPAREGAQALYLVVEKILSLDEELDRTWPVGGTSGYDFLDLLNMLFVNDAGLGRLQRFYQRILGDPTTFADLSRETKTLIMETSLAGELTVLALRLDRMSEANRLYRDFTFEALRDGLRDVIACLRVYRTYITETRRAAKDVEVIRAAVEAAKFHNPATEPSIYDFIGRVLLPPGEDLEEAARRDHYDFILKCQQYTGPVQAKGVEDTAFYRFNPLIALNEVGGEPDRGGLRSGEFHSRMLSRLERWPEAMLATSTHDTKRGEDARMRILALTAAPDVWVKACRSWFRSNGKYRSVVAGRPAPSINDEYFLYQTLIGSWPNNPEHAASDSFVERVVECMKKATKEAKIHTSWIQPREEYDTAVELFVRRILRASPPTSFLRAFGPVQRLSAQCGAVYSLAQVCLKLLAPGRPDFYQGSELWELSMVDPDNRRPVDYALRNSYLDAIASSAPTEERARRLLAEWNTGEVKLLVSYCGLMLRKAFSRVFTAGSYIPLSFEGAYAHSLTGVVRSCGGEAVLGVGITNASPMMSSLTAGKFPLGREAWGDTTLTLPPSVRTVAWTDALTGSTYRLGSGESSLPLAELFAVLPVALLSSSEPEEHDQF